MLEREGGGGAKGRGGHMGRWVGLIETDFFFRLYFVCLRGGRAKGETVLYGSRRSTFLTNEKRKSELGARDGDGGVVWRPVA